jgi:DNA-binding NarL/FixJ family response regulator
MEELELTYYDKEILRMKAEGYTTRGVAYGLNLSVSTVANDLRTLLKKVGALNITNAVYIACQKGWLA